MQTKHARVVVGVDGSPASRSALVVALGEAARRRADLEVVVACSVVLPWTLGLPLLPDVAATLADGRARGRAALEEARKHVAVATLPRVGDGEAEVVAVEGSAGPALVERSAAADLLVVGSRGRGAARSALLGSAALHCVAHAHCPVLVVHGDPGDVPPASPVVLGLDDSAVSREALRQAAEEATRLRVDLEVVMAYRPMSDWSDLYAVLPPPTGRTREQVEERGRAILREVLGHDGGVATRLVTQEGDAGGVLVRRATGARLLVVGSQTRGRLEGIVLGSVALHCAIHAGCPVLVVHPRRGAVPDAVAPAPDEPATAG